jgi:hypothetical protein
METQYITDREGNKTAVIIPIADWELLLQKHTELKALAESILAATTEPEQTEL